MPRSDVVLLPPRPCSGYWLQSGIQAIAAAMAPILSQTKLLTEPSGVASYAALLSGKTGIEPGSKVVCVLSGGNVGLDKLITFLQ